MLQHLENLRSQLTEIEAVEGLKFLAREFPNKVVFSTSLGMEDQVITHLIYKHQIPIKVFTLALENSQKHNIFFENFYPSL